MTGARRGAAARCRRQHRQHAGCQKKHRIHEARYGAIAALRLDVSQCLPSLTRPPARCVRMGFDHGPSSNAAFHQNNELLLEWTPHLRYAMGS